MRCVSSGITAVSQGDSIIVRSPSYTPHVLLLGGQDTPTAKQLLRRWRHAVGWRLPSHRVSTFQWPREPGAAPPALMTLDAHEASRALRRQRSAPPEETFPAWLDRAAYRGATRALAVADRLVRVDEKGKPAGTVSRIVYRYARYSIDALYDRAGLGSALVALAKQALGAAHFDLVVAHSFGGTLALRAAWELDEGAPGFPRIDLITLGTASGPTIARSKLLQPMRGRDGRLAKPRPLSSWSHFYSPSDAFLGAPSLPAAFDGVSVRAVDTGRFLRPGFGHALYDYLSTGPVFEAIRKRLDSAADTRVAPEDCRSA